MKSGYTFFLRCSAINACMTSPMLSTFSSNFNSRSWSYNSLDNEICGYFLEGAPLFPAISTIMTNIKIKIFSILSMKSICLLTRNGLSIMSISMSRKKFPQISVSRDTWTTLDDLKFELRARSFDQVLRILIQEHKNKGGFQ